MKRLWVSESDYMDIADGSLSAEITRRTRSLDFTGFMQWLPNPDPVLRKMGKSIDVYEELLADGHLSGVIRRRKAGTKKLKWMLDAEGTDGTGVDIATAMLKKLPMRKIIGEMLKGADFGFQVSEVVWQSKSGYIIPAAIKGRPARWFVFNPDNQLLFLSRDNPMGEQLPARKFLLTRHNESDDNPYGQSILSSCFWPIVIKKGGIQFLLTFAEKYGMPWTIATYDQAFTKTQDAVDAFADSIDSMVQDGVIVISKDKTVEVVPTGSQANVEIFKALPDLADREMSKAVLGHGAAADSTSGKLGNEDGAESATADTIDDDKAMVEESFNELLGWIYEFNFAGATPPKFTLFREADVDKDRADRDKVLYDQGVRLKKVYYAKTYDINEEEFDIVEPTSAPAGGPMGFSEGACPHCGGDHAEGSPAPADGQPSIPADQRSIDLVGGKLTPEQMQFQMEQVLKPILDLVSDASDFNEVMTALAEQFPKMNTADLQAVLERAIFITETVGRVAVDAE